MRSFLLVALATTATSSLLPRTLNEYSLMNPAVLHRAEANPMSRSLLLACPDCPCIHTPNSDMAGLQSMPEPEVELTITIDNRVADLGHDRLLVNDIEIYPNPGSNPQLPASIVHEPPCIHNFGYVLGMEPATDAAATASSMVEMSMSVVNMDLVPVYQVPTVVIVVNKDPSGRLTISTVNTVPTEPKSQPCEHKSMMACLYHCLAKVKSTLCHLYANHSMDRKSDCFLCCMVAMMGNSANHMTMIFLAGIGTGVGLSIMSITGAIGGMLLLQMLARRRKAAACAENSCRTGDYARISDEEASLMAHQEIESLSGYQDDAKCSRN